MAPLRRSSTTSRLASRSPYRRRRLLETGQALNTQSFTLTAIPRYTTEEAREDLLQDIEEEVEKAVVKSRQEVNCIEHFIRRCPDRYNQLNHAGIPWEPEEGVTFQWVMELIDKYNQSDQAAIEMARKAMDLKIETKRLWAEAARLRDTQGALVHQLWESEIHHRVHKVLETGGEDFSKIH